MSDIEIQGSATSKYAANHMVRIPSAHTEMLSCSPARPYLDCGNDLNCPPYYYLVYGNGLWSKFWIYIQIIANLRPKTYFFIRTLERLVGIFPGFSATVVLSFASQLRVRIIDGNILKSVSNRSCRQGKSDSEVLINYASSSFLVYY